MAEDAWNSFDSKRVSLAYSEDSDWRNRDEFFVGREEIVASGEGEKKKNLISPSMLRIVTPSRRVTRWQG